MMDDDNFIEGIHFYFDVQGLIVFTETSHLRRGYCCGNSCKHCPYNYEKVTDQKKSLKRNIPDYLRKDRETSG